MQTRSTDLALRRAPEALPRTFFECGAQTLAQKLLGKLIVGDAGASLLRIVETEAYQQDDPACHAFRGRSQANRSLFGPAGCAYVYFTYGMHYCCNASCGRPEAAGGALLRAARVIRGADRIRPRRRTAGLDRDLARGPARLAACLEINRDDDGLDLSCPESRFFLATDGLSIKAHEMLCGPRVGVRLAADRPWRYYLQACAEVSAYRRHPKAVSV